MLGALGRDDCTRPTRGEDMTVGIGQEVCSNSFLAYAILNKGPACQDLVTVSVALVLIQIELIWIRVEAPATPTGNHTVSYLRGGVMVGCGFTYNFT